MFPSSPFSPYTQLIQLTLRIGIICNVFIFVDFIITFSPNSPAVPAAPVSPGLPGGPLAPATPGRPLGPPPPYAFE